ncbi:MAG: hypothetical protein NZM38_10140 [Cytophagales bacterium]|nr:hypothetical protein [Cytophagales bacterium]MDW8385114.1 DUF6687 family protein [Flammeovirgaceae bacterium]
MHKKEFIGLHEVSFPAIMVDGTSIPNAFVLSHWKGLNTHPFADDTSAGIVLNALQQQISALDEIKVVTATHFDVDGFLGVWALFYPEIALKFENILRQAALIGDFREFDVENPDAIEGLKVVCLLNALEKKLFYPPFGAKQETKACVSKFMYFIPAFSQMLIHINEYKNEWKDEFEKVLADCDVLYSSNSNIQKYPNIGLVVIRTPQPLHYYALFSATKGYDAVLSIYNHRQYELEYKYVTWIDLVSRPTFPRANLAPLAQTLNQEEDSGFTWEADKITEGGAMLRLKNQHLSRKEKFANPYERLFASSSIHPDDLEKTVIEFYQKAYQDVLPKKQWTWKQIRELNEHIQHNKLT